MAAFERQYILTRWGTIVHADAAGQLRTGDFCSAPRNVFLTEDGLLHIESSVPQPVERVAAGHGILQGLKQDGRFFCADPQGGFAASRPWLRNWEQCLLISAQHDQDLLTILDNDWTLADGEIIPRRKITLGHGFILNFGARQLDLAEHAHALIVERSGEHVSAIGFVAAGWQVCSARRFRPLIYFTAFGQEHIFEMLRLCLQSISLFANYTGKILVLCDRDPEPLAAYIPEALAGRVMTGKHQASDYHSRLMARYEIAAQPIDEFQPVLYMDLDMICNAPLPPLLAACNQADFFYASSEHGVTLDKMEDRMREWFGGFLFTAAGLKLSDYHGLNSGALAFSNANFARKTLDGIKAGLVTYRSDFPTESGMGDQPYVSFFLQSRNLVNPTMLNEYIRFKSQNFNRAEPSTGLVHFNFWVGGDKTQEMSDYLNELQAEAANASWPPPHYLPPDTSSTAPVV